MNPFFDAPCKERPSGRGIEVDRGHPRRFNISPDRGASMASDLEVKILGQLRTYVLGARGNVRTVRLKMLAQDIYGAKRKILVKAFMDQLAVKGLVEVDKRTDEKRYILRRGTPLWEALERGVEDALALLERERVIQR